MNWSVQIKEKAVKSLAKINRKDAETIWHFLETELPTMENPRQKGKALVGEFKGMWRYRIGNYRIICEIQDNQVTVMVVEVEHRSKIYKSR